MKLGKNFACVEGGACFISAVTTKVTAISLYGRRIMFAEAMLVITTALHGPAYARWRDDGTGGLMSKPC